MHILLVAATELETEIFRASRNKPIFANHTVEILITGVGIMAATYSLTKAIYAKKPDLVLAGGIAGGFADRTRPGETVIISEDGLGDLGAGEENQFVDTFDLELSNPDEFPFSEGRLRNPYDMSFLALPGMQVVKGLTVNHIRTHQSFLYFISEKYDAAVETLEGAAIHYVCLNEKVPFLHIRSVSNVAGERDKSKWLIRESLENLSLAFEKVLMQID